MKHKIFLAAALAAYLLAGRDLRAAPYANGDLLLGFVAESSPGDTTTLVVRLGSAASFRDATTNNVNLLNIGSQLASTFGATWYDRIDLYMSVFASTDSSSLSTTLTNGDPNRTLYATKTRTAVGTLGLKNSTAWGGVSYSDGTMSEGANRITACGARYGLSDADASNVALIDDAPGNTLDEFTRPTTSTSFNTFNGGIEFKFAAGSWASGASFGDAGVVEAALDLYRLQARNDISGQSGFGAAVRSGSYEGTFTINQSGQVSFIVTGAAPAGYDSWATANGITGQPFTGDYDKDGLSNGVEYALGTNPTVFNSMPGLVSAGADFTLTVPKGTQAAADSALAYKFETSTDLSSWTMVNPTTQNSTSASYTLPGGLSKNFVRFKAVKTP